MCAPQCAAHKRPMEQLKLISMSNQTAHTWMACNACPCRPACLDSCSQPLGAARCAVPVLSKNINSTSAL